MAAATLLCKQCNFENEPERVYCHNCGAKLDRALLPPEATKREDPQVVRNRVRSVVQPRRFAAIPLLKNLCLSLLVAAVLAALILIALPPANQPPRLSDDAVLAAPPIADNIEDLIQAPSPQRQIYTEEQVNGFLQATLRAKDESTFGITVKYERTFVRFREGLCQATLQESLFGYSLFVSSTDAVEIKNGQLVTHPVAGALGRLQVPGKLMPSVEKTLAPMWAAVEPYKKLVGRLGAIVFHKGTVEVTGKSAADR